MKMMERLTTTPFGQRSLTAGLLAHAQQAQQPASIAHINKWELFRELCVARHAYGVSDRDLTVLNALLSFHRDTNLSDNGCLIVFPSNAALSERAHGMAESTLRRHLAALCHAGLIQRHDSPNGKRYAARGAGGEIIRAFGFDLRPLLVHGQDIVHAASEARAAAQRLRRLREEIMVMKRDAIKLSAYGQENHPDAAWPPLLTRLLNLHKSMRRVMSLDDLISARAGIEGILVDIHAVMKHETTNMGGNDRENARHYQNSNTDSYDSELSHENVKGVGRCSQSARPVLADNEDERISGQAPRIPLMLVLKACPDILPYCQGSIRHWPDLIRTADFVRGMMGVSPDAWEQAQSAMGPENAAITLVGILQRISEINSPGGYLRALSRKAQDGGFSPGPMVMALLKTDQKAA